MGAGILGSFEELVLLAILGVGAEAYAVPIRREIEQRSGADVAMGAVYATLDRLESKGLLASAVESRSGDVGRPRRFYRVRSAGLAALEETRSVRAAMWKGIDIAPSGGRRT